ncbi:MAG: hypothetical protein IJX99_02185 [Clostridia bacterium]|nr:hypothetical protein [Clostridia bacterium]
MIIIDGQTFDVGITKITRKASQSAESLGTTLDGKKHYDVKGTYYDYDVTFNTRAMNVVAYDRLYELITEPVEHHTVTIPYGQSTITFLARTKVGNDTLKFNYTNAKKWGGFTVTFESLEPQREV